MVLRLGNRQEGEALSLPLSLHTPKNEFSLVSDICLAVVDLVSYPHRDHVNGRFSTKVEIL